MHIQRQSTIKSTLHISMIRKYYISIVDFFVLHISESTLKFIRKLVPNSLLARLRRPKKYVYILSYPCSGRTWLRLMIGRALQFYFKTDHLNPFEIHQFSNAYPSMAKISLQHDGNPMLRKPSELETDKSRFRGTKVILLVRDPRDTVVSWYFEITRRRHLPGSEAPEFEGSLRQFCHEERAGLNTIIGYMNSWAENRNVPDGFLLVRYEDLHKDAGHELARIFEFLDMPDVPEKIIFQAVDFAAFDNMRRMEKENTLEIEVFQPGNESDENSFKTRVGKTGGWHEHFSAEEIQFINQRIKNNLSSCFGYSDSVEGAG